MEDNDDKSIRTKIEIPRGYLKSKLDFSVNIFPQREINPVSEPFTHCCFVIFQKTCSNQFCII